MTAIQHWTPGARAVARCPCGGALMLVEDHGGAQPLEAQCATCGVLTGVARVAAEQLVEQPAREDLGF